MEKNKIIEKLKDKVILCSFCSNEKQEICDSKKIWCEKYEQLAQEIVKFMPVIKADEVNKKLIKILEERIEILEDKIKIQEKIIQIQEKK